MHAFNVIPSNLLKVDIVSILLYLYSVVYVVTFELLAVHAYLCGGQMFCVGEV